MESSAKLFGHSIHAMLIALPIGLLVTAVIFDVLHFVAKSGPWTLISYYLIAAGVIGGLVAALFGFIDYLAIPAGTRATRVGRLHGIGNVVVVLLFLASWWLRRTSPHVPTGSALTVSLLGVALAAVTAWLGGGRAAIWEVDPKTGATGSMPLVCGTPEVSRWSPPPERCGPQ